MTPLPATGCGFGTGDGPWAQHRHSTSSTWVPPSPHKVWLNFFWTQTCRSETAKQNWLWSGHISVPFHSNDKARWGQVNFPQKFERVSYIQLANIPKIPWESFYGLLRFFKEKIKKKILYWQTILRYFFYTDSRIPWTVTITETCEYGSEETETVVSTCEPHWDATMHFLQWAAVSTGCHRANATYI